MKGTIKQKRAHARLRSHRTRFRIHGTAACPRMSVARSLKHISVQLIDDDQGKTLAAAGDALLKTKMLPVQTAAQVGKLLAQKAQALAIKQAVFDRGSYRYHGRVAALADGAREGGLKF